MCDFHSFLLFFFCEDPVKWVAFVLFVPEFGAQFWLFSLCGFVVYIGRFVDGNGNK